ncbi:MAG: HAD family phosphatase [Lachnospiraceae bacterium]|nr:HAD family phosphatase [Lachnospiraceae bacterium]
MKYKLIAADMDGTLLDDRKIITPKNLSAIKKAMANGSIFAFSTGRPPIAVEPYRKIIDENVPVIAYNGAMVVLGENDIFFNQTLTKEQATIILEHVRKYNTMACIWSRNRLYVTELGARADKYKINVMTEPVLFDDPETIINQGITKFLWYDTAERTAFFRQELAEPFGKLGITVCPSTSEYLEFFSSNVSKALSLERLAKHYGIRREEIIAFGDNFNDLEMIEYAGLGVAMQNAPDGVKNAADFVTVSNNEDGIAYVLEKFF